VTRNTRTDISILRVLRVRKKSFRRVKDVFIYLFIFRNAKNKGQRARGRETDRRSSAPGSYWRSDNRTTNRKKNKTVYIIGSGYIYPFRPFPTC
jgi:hypothetical protein